MSVLVVVEHDRGTLAPATCEAIAAARLLAEPLGATVDALLLGDASDGALDTLGEHGAETIHHAAHPLLADYGPESWGAAVADAIGALGPRVVLAAGTDRGNEVVAQAAARLDLPFAANCTSITPGESTELTRVRWGGSLLEHATLEAGIVLATTALHAFDATPVTDRGAATVVELPVELDERLARSVVRSRVEREAGVTLATAPVVVGGGRGVGSAEGFAQLEELAAVLGGVVGCSRAVTNNGWRNHADQVGQTGTRIAPEVYLACGISGAIQHWVGAKASKHIIAVNTDAEANMVTKADQAVIGDLHEVIPAITAEIARRRA